MKKSILLFLVLALIIVAAVYAYNQRRLAMAPTTSHAIPTPAKQQKVKPTITSVPKIAINEYCTADDIDARISLEPAAGNVYGTLTLKNISTKNCSINGNAYIQPTSSASNITITKEGEQGATYISLKPDQTVYSQVHFPNGPQCNGGTVTKSITFAYQISPSQTVTFADSQSSFDQTLTACTADDEKTAVQVWGISDSALH